MLSSPPSSLLYSLILERVTRSRKTAQQLRLKLSAAAKADKQTFSNFPPPTHTHRSLALLKLVAIIQVHLPVARLAAVVGEGVGLVDGLVEGAVGVGQGLVLHIPPGLVALLAEERHADLRPVLLEPEARPPPFALADVQVTHLTLLVAIIRQGGVEEAVDCEESVLDGQGREWDALL
jgi:hypothetical protein